MTEGDSATRISEHRLDAEGAPIRVRVYEPAHPIGSGLVWIHGGGFFMNDIDVPEAHWVAQCLADAGIAVVSPDYRLASESVHFPTLTDDCAAAWRWAVGGRAPLATQPTTWHIGGGSAGANLAASVALQLRDGTVAGPPAPSTVLIYPILHSPLPAPSPELAAKIATLPQEERYSTENVENIDLLYAGERSLLRDPRVFPGFGDLVGMPPALIVNCEYDPLRASGELYGEQLIAAGVDTTVIRELDAHHGHLNFPDQPAAQRTVRRMIDWLSGSALIGTTHPAG